MRLLKYLTLAIVLLQIPFVYRICQSAQLDSYTSQLPREVLGRVPFDDIRGSLHVHSAAGSHSLGTFLDIIQAAREAGYRYVFITDHPKEYELFNQIKELDLIVIYGLEEEREDEARHLRSPDSRVKILSEFSTATDFPEDVTGLELFNLAESARLHNMFVSAMTWVYHRLAYEDLFFFHTWEFNRSRFQYWNEALTNRPVPAFAGNNAHQNIGIVLLTTSGDRLIEIMVDPYLQSFRAVTNHVFLPDGSTLTEDSVLDALRKGSSYICFEQIADPTGFTFHAEMGGSVFPMGASVPRGSNLVFQSPIPAEFRLYRSGEVVERLEGLRFSYSAEDEGPYRVEVYPSDPPPLIENKPWIISNPIYVSEP